MAIRNVAMLIKPMLLEGHYEIWASNDILEVVQSLDGIGSCVFTGTHASVVIDPRYDKDSVLKDIEDLVGVNNVAIKRAACSKS